jgi:hypothetical protein
MATNLSDWLGLVVPEDTINLIFNPSAEIGIVGWSTTNLTLSRALGGIYGAYTFTGTPSAANGNANFYTGVYNIGDSLTYHGWVKADSPLVRLEIRFAGSAVASVNHPGDGQWHWLSVTGVSPSNVADGIVYVLDARTSGWTAILFDGMQAERKAYATTYCDGEQESCYWQATEHMSQSYRPTTARTGGRLLTFRQLGINVRFMAGAGAPTISNLRDPYAILPGAEYQGQSVPERTITLTATITSLTHQGLLVLRQTLLQSIFRPGARNEPLLLWYGTTPETMRWIRVYYDGGLEMGEIVSKTESVAIRFLSTDPYWESTHDLNVSSSALKVRDTSSVGLMVKRATDSPLYFGGGVSAVGWSRMTTPTDNITKITKIHQGLSGRIYVAGTFTQIGGISAANIAYLDTLNGPNPNWHAMAGGVPAGTILDMCEDLLGNLYVVGSFTDLAGIAAADYIARWNVGTSAWEAVPNLTTHTPTATCYTVCCSVITGLIFYMATVGGNYNVVAFNPYASTRTPYIVLIVGGTGAGAGAPLVYSMRQHPKTGEIYVGGAFAAANGGSFVAKNIFHFSESGAMTAMGSLDGSVVRSIAFDTRGRTYIAGLIPSETGGEPALGGVAMWNGSNWEDLLQGVQSNGTAGQGPMLLAAAPDGSIWMNTTINFANSIFVNGLAFALFAQLYVKQERALLRWNGQQWTDIDLSFIGPLNASTMAPQVEFTRNGDMIVGHQDNVTDTDQPHDPVSITVDAPTPLRIKIVSSTLTGTFDSTNDLKIITNYTTGKSLRFNHLDLSVIAVTDIDTNPKRPTVRQGSANKMSTLLADSNVASFGLVPGTNKLAAFSPGVTGTISYIWRQRAHSIDFIPSTP